MSRPTGSVWPAFHVTGYGKPVACRADGTRRRRSPESARPLRRRAPRRPAPRPGGPRLQRSPSTACAPLRGPESGWSSPCPDDRRISAYSRSTRSRGSWPGRYTPAKDPNRIPSRGVSWCLDSKRAGRHPHAGEGIGKCSPESQAPAGPTGRILSPFFTRVKLNPSRLTASATSIRCSGVHGQ